MRSLAANAIARRSLTSFWDVCSTAPVVGISAARMLPSEVADSSAVAARFRFVDSLEMPTTGFECTFAFEVWR